MELGPLTIIGLAAVAFLCGLMKVGFGLGTGVLCTTLASLLLPARSAVGFLAPLMWFSEVAAAATYPGAWDRRHLAALIPAALVGTWLGTNLLVSLPAALLRRSIGVLAVGFALLDWRNQARKARGSAAPVCPAALPDPGVPVAPATAGGLSSHLLSAAVGVASGVLSGLSHAGGIVLSMYLLKLGLGKEAFLASFAVALLFQNTLKIGLYWRFGLLARDLLLLGLATFPAVVVGGMAGRRLNSRLSTQAFRRALSALLLVSGAYLLLAG